MCREFVLPQPGTVALVCERCPSAEPAHVKIEGSRLLAALVKHCKSERELVKKLLHLLSCVLVHQLVEVMRSVISEGGVKLMASLLESEHVLLQNEALVALNLLATIRGDEITVSLSEEAVLLGVWGVVSNGDSSTELLANALTFLHQLMQSDIGANVHVSANTYTAHVCINAGLIVQSCVSLPTYCLANVSEKLRSLDGFVERMKVLSQHSNEAVRDKAKELIQTSLDPTQDS